jgi:tRNA U34 5-carboxymethylaminomethyl modifying enzyme MnmG/GidA
MIDELQSYCLKIKEMDDEEYSYQALQEPLYRVETGNYEYRLILRCRQDAKGRFASLRSDVMVKLELLDQKHVQDVVCQLQKLLRSLSTMNTESYKIVSEANHFPLEVDLSSHQTFQYPDPNSSPYQEDHDDDEGEEDVKMPADLLVAD